MTPLGVQWLCSVLYFPIGLNIEAPCKEKDTVKMMEYSCLWGCYQKNMAFVLRNLSCPLTALFWKKPAPVWKTAIQEEARPLVGQLLRNWILQTIASLNLDLLPVESLGEFLAFSKSWNITSWDTFNRRLWDNTYLLFSQQVVTTTC